jgi:hypothetical protein
MYPLAFRITRCKGVKPNHKIPYGFAGGIAMDLGRFVQI